MKIRIDSNGQPNGSRISDRTTGRDISSAVTSVAFVHRANKLPTVSLEIVFLPVHIEGEADFRAIDPKTGEMKVIRRVEFADGSVFEPADPTTTNAG